MLNVSDGCLLEKLSEFQEMWIATGERLKQEKPCTEPRAPQPLHTGSSWVSVDACSAHSPLLSGQAGQETHHEDSQLLII